MARRFKKTRPEPEQNDRNHREDPRYQPGDHPEAVRATAERNPADVRAPNTRDQHRRQEYHREHREYVEVSVGVFLNLRP